MASMKFRAARAGARYQTKTSVQATSASAMLRGSTRSMDMVSSRTGRIDLQSASYFIEVAFGMQVTVC